MIYVVVPTYNEVHNIERLVEGLIGLGLEMKILFVDDSSPDQTAQKVLEVAQRFPQVHLLQRLGKGGRGGACLAGFQWVFDQGLQDSDQIVEMDGDLSHDPKDLPKLLDKLADYDVIVGSRYLPGGNIEKWPWHRIILSKFANRWARFVLGIPLTDYTTGYRAYRAQVLHHIDYHRIQSRGYIVLTEMAWQLHNKGFTLGEVPITFVNRIRGESNLTFGEIFSAFLNVLRLRFYK